VYAERAADTELFEALRAGTTCHILSPRQSGKSSLAVRTAARLSREGVACVSVSLAELGGTAGGEEAWYTGLVDRIVADVPTWLPEGEADRFWAACAGLTPSARWGAFLRDVLVARVPVPVVIFFDELEATLSLPFARDDFFVALRGVLDGRAANPSLGRLTLCLLGATTARELALDPARAPLAVSRGVDLHDFTRAELAPFEAGFAGLRSDPAVVIDAVYGFTSGHPYMTQRICADLGERPGASPAEVVQDRFLLRGRADDPDLAWADQRFARTGGDPRAKEMLIVYERILAGDDVTWDPADEVRESLRMTGLVAPRFDGVVRWLLQPRNRIVRSVFDAEWIRQRQAERLLAEPISRWLESGRRDEALLRGEELERSASWAVGREDMTPAERAFLKASRAAERRRKLETFGLWVFAATTAALVVAVVAFYWAWRGAESDLALARRDASRAVAERSRALTEAALTAAARDEAMARAERERAERERAAADRTAALAAAAEATRLRDAVLGRVLASASRLTATTTPERRLLLATESVRLGGGPHDPPPPVAEEALRTALDVDLGVPLPLGSIGAAAIAADGTTLAVADDAGAIRVWSGGAGALAPRVAPTYTLAAGGPVSALAVTPGGEAVVAGRVDGVVLSGPAGGALTPRTTVAGPVRLVATDAAGQRLCAVDGAGQAHLSDPDRDGGAPRALLAEATAVAVTPNGRWAFVASATQGTAGYELTGAEPLATELRSARSRGADQALATTVDSGRVAVGSDGGEVKLWSLRGGLGGRVPPVVLRDRGVRAAVRALAVTPGGTDIAVAHADRAVRLWVERDERYRVAATLRGHDHPLAAVGIFAAPDEAAPSAAGDGPARPPVRVLTVPVAGPARLWTPDAPSADTEPFVLDGHDRGVTAAAVSPDGHLLASGDGRGRVRLWELGEDGPRRAPVAAFKAHRTGVAGLALRADGTLLTASERSVLVWSVAELRALPVPAEGELPEPPPRSSRSAGAPVGALALGPAGRLLALGLDGAPPALWELAAPGPDDDTTAGLVFHPQPLAWPGSAPGTAHAVAVSPDGARLAAVLGVAPAPLVWATGGESLGELVRVFDGEASPARAVAWLPDGSQLATGHVDGGVRLWQLADGASPTALAGTARRPIVALTVSPDGQRLAAGSARGTVLLWNLPWAAAGPITLRGHRGPVRAVRFTPDGRWLVSGADDGRLRVRRVTTEALLELACRRAGRDLTAEEWRAAAGPVPWQATCP
jgi:WD40 repeat protein